MCPANSCWILIDRLCTSCLFCRSIYRNDLCWRIEVVHNLTWLSSMTMKRTLSSSSRREAGPGVHQRPHFRPSALSLPGSARRASAFRWQAVHKPREGHLDRSDPPVRAKGGREAPASLRAFQAAVVGSSCRTRSCVVAPVGMSGAPCRWCMADRRVRTPCAVSGTIPNHHPLYGDPEWCFHRDPRPAAAPCG